MSLSTPSATASSTTNNDASEQDGGIIPRTHTRTHAKAQNKLVCVDCRTAPACVKCCDELLCLLHAYCTKHAQHPSMWRIIDKDEYTHTRTEVEDLRKIVIAQLERDLNAAEDRARAAQAVAMTSGGAIASSSSAAPAAASAAAHTQTHTHTHAHTHADTGASSPASSKALKAPVVRMPTFNEIRRQTLERAQQAAAEPVHAGMKRPAPASDAHTRTHTHTEGLEEVEDPTARRTALPENVYAHVARAAQDRELQAQVGVSSGSDSSAPGSLHPVIEARIPVPEPTPPLASEEGSAALDSVRANVVDALSTGLLLGHLHDTGATDATGSTGSERLKPTAIKALAAGVEAALFAKYGRTASENYRRHARELVSEMQSRANAAAAFRKALVTGEIGPLDFVNIPIESFASTELQSERTALRAAALASVDDSLMWSSCTYMCPRCSSEDTEYMPISAVRDIRKAEVWGSSDLSDTRFRIRCKRCGAEWIREVL